MFAEHDDWVSFNVAPFIWSRHESKNETFVSMETLDQPSGGVNPSARNSSDDLENELLVDDNTTPSRSIDPPSGSCSSNLEELKTPLLERDKDKPQETTESKKPPTTSCQNVYPQETNVLETETNSSQMSTGSFDRLDSMDETRPKKMGRREKMHDLRRKMSEKFEEKKRNIGEKSRSIVERMRGP